VIACDGIVAAKKETLSAMAEGRTFVALNLHAAPTAALVHDPDWAFPVAGCEAALRQTVGDARLGAFDAEEVAVKLLGDSIYTNPLMLGYAWQKGHVPVGSAALLRAMELNGVQVANNQQAFEWGRRCAHDLASVRSQYQSAQVIQLVRRPSVDELIARRVEFLTAYQNAGYAEQYRRFVERVRSAEAPLASTRLTEAVARYLFKLMAYKDEYEVARLHGDAAFAARIASQFEGNYKLVHHLAPPILGKTDAQGQPLKQAFGPWMHRVMPMLARLKFLRGSTFDPFGRTEERRTERALIGEYRACVEELLTGLSAERLTQAVEIARLPEDIRGYGPVKERHLAAVRPRWAQLMTAWRSGAGHRQAA